MRTEDRTAEQTDSSVLRHADSRAADAASSPAGHDASDAAAEDALEALLAQWAEAEIDPPADFHQRTMARLRTEASAMPPSTADSPSATRKHGFTGKSMQRWLAAAAVLALCALPLGYLLQQGAGGAAGNPQTPQVSRAAEPEQQDVSVDTAPENPSVAEQTPSPNATGGQVSAQRSAEPSIDDTPADSNAGAGGSAPVQPPSAETQDDGTDDDGQTPMVAALDPLGENGTDSQGAVFSLPRSASQPGTGTEQKDNPPEDISDKPSDTDPAQETDIETLQAKIRALQSEIAQLQARLSETPDDAELKAELTARTAQLDTLEQTLSRLQDAENEPESDEK